MLLCNLCVAHRREIVVTALSLGTFLMAQEKNLPAMQGDMGDMCLIPLEWEDLLEGEMATHPVFLPGKSHGQRSLAGCSPKGCRVGDNQGHK